MQIAKRGHTNNTPGHKGGTSASRVEPTSTAEVGPFAAILAMGSPVRPELGRVVVWPFATIGVLTAVLIWEVEHVGPIALAFGIGVGVIVAGVVVARRVRRQIEELAAHYQTLLRVADEQSRQAEDANRVKDEFLATLSHELRTPLNSVLGWARLLASGRLDAPHTDRAIRAIERAGWAQSRLIEDLLDISRAITGKLQISPRPVVVQPLIEAAVDSLRPAAEAKQMAIEIDLDPGLGSVAVDPDRLQQIVWNLVSNAIKFTPSGGHVTVRLRADSHDLVLSVADTGIGLTLNLADHLFERFRQADSSSTRLYGGLGLGLGIVRHLVELHGGTVTATSRGENQGATFEVRLPLRTLEHRSADRWRQFDAPPVLHGVSVLVVDDDPHALEFVRTTLEQYGAMVATVSSAKEARARVMRSPPDVLLSDLVMPDEDGLQLIREIRELDEAHGGKTPAAALTALARSEDRRRALSAGYQMHVAKPIDPLELATAVERLAHGAARSG
jgi:signal transduction histidine kinase/CheY-like chemotaxis protein